MSASLNDDAHIIELEDTTSHRLDVGFLAGGRGGRDPTSLTARLAEQLLRQNRGVLETYDVGARVHYDGDRVALDLSAGSIVGALPLVSPTTGRCDHGIVIRPRFGWDGIGPILGATGWRVVPSILGLPQLPRSDRKVPAWVLSSVVIERMATLLRQVTRRFEMREEELPAPRGSVQWSRYATTSLPNARLLEVPCRFPDLREDEQLLAAIHYTLKHHFGSLSSQRTSGAVVVQLLSRCEDLLRRVRKYPATRPAGDILRQWASSSMAREAMREGVDAIEWTVDERGLAGASELSGLPWMLRMEEFFEAWVEAITANYAALSGGEVRVGRKRQTTAYLDWKPRYSGTQKYLLPDIIIDEAGRDVIVDAKYKRHWEELNIRGWQHAADYIRESHREDLLQVLAYANISRKPHVVSVLVYPCTKATWESLKRRERLFHRAEVASGARRVELILTAVPMGSGLKEAGSGLRQALAQTA